jgi:hypothetical protein
MAWGNSWDKPEEVSALWKDADGPIAKVNYLKKQGSNLVDSEGLLYFQCHGCEAIHDPETKSFATLHDTAHRQGWKIKWNATGQGYKIYCVKCKDNIECGEGVG